MFFLRNRFGINLRILLVIFLTKMVRLGGVGRRRGLDVGLGEALLPDWARGARIRRADAATCFEYC